MADQESIFNPLEAELQDEVSAPGIKRPGTAMETHQATFADSHVIDSILTATWTISTAA